MPRGRRSRRGEPRPITFLSDYGYEDEFAGVCRAVMAGIAPGSKVIDITHGIGRAAVRQGAVVLANSLPYAPAGVHLAVVDPGVGSDRRPVAVRVANQDRVLVGPDNGLLALAIERLGGARDAVDIALSRFRLEPVSATFHGRDLFAPVAARIAAGAALGDAGEAIPTESLGGIDLPEPRIYPERLIAHAIAADRFGNVALNVAHEQIAEGPLRLGRQLEVETSAGQFEAVFARTFADVEPGRLLVYEDSSRSLSLAVNRGSAVERLGVGPDDEVVLRRL
jgi:S-adenosyl-L-methionine hydrolase (adenosine-forming)